jgi:hypothetical protein
MMFGFYINLFSHNSAGFVGGIFNETPILFFRLRDVSLEPEDIDEIHQNAALYVFNDNFTSPHNSLYHIHITVICNLS